MSENKPEVVEHGGYSGGGAPNSDTTSFDNRTPAGADAYREVADSQGQDAPQYVIGLDGPQDAHEGPFLDRDKLARSDGQAINFFERANTIDPYKLAGAGLVLVVVLGGMGLYAASIGPVNEIKPLEEVEPSELQIQEAEGRQVDGVNVRQGLQQRTPIPAGMPGEDAPVNAIPSGERSSGSAPTPAPAGDATPDAPPAGEAAAEEEPAIPSGDRPG